MNTDTRPDGSWFAAAGWLSFAMAVAMFFPIIGLAWLWYAAGHARKVLGDRPSPKHRVMVLVPVLSVGPVALLPLGEGVRGGLMLATLAAAALALRAGERARSRTRA